MSKFQYHDSVTVETEVKKSEDLDSYNEDNFQFFGLSEKGTQTELTMKDINEMDKQNKEIKEMKSFQKISGKLDNLTTHDIQANNQNNKKDVNSKTNEIKNNNSNSNLIDELSNKKNDSNNTIIMIKKMIIYIQIIK